MVENRRPSAMRRLVAILSELPATRVVATSADADALAEDRRVAALAASIQQGAEDDPEPEASSRWWVKLDIDIRAHMAWHVIQELGFVLNYISIDERLPTVFMPTSSPPYLNGGPDVYLGWVIESTADDVDPAYIAEVLKGRLPDPIHDLGQWARCESDPCDVPTADVDDS